MFAWWDVGPYLVGVVSGYEKVWKPGFWPWQWGQYDDSNVIAGGKHFCDLIRWGRTNWPK